MLRISIFHHLVTESIEIAIVSVGMPLFLPSAIQAACWLGKWWGRIWPPVPSSSHWMPVRGPAIPVPTCFSHMRVYCDSPKFIETYWNSVSSQRKEDVPKNKPSTLDFCWSMFFPPSSWPTQFLTNRLAHSHSLHQKSVDLGSVDPVISCQLRYLHEFQTCHWNKCHFQ